MAAITKEKARDTFLRTCKAVVKVWAETEGMTDEEKIDGAIFSVLSIIDGSNLNLPIMDIVLRLDPEDKQDCIDNGKDYYEDGMVINDDVMLHDMWGKY